MSQGNVIEVVNLHYDYISDGTPTPVLHGVDLKVQPGELVALYGPSGSGKSTLFHILGGLLRSSKGEVWIDGLPLHKSTDEELSRYRNSRLGFVFQQFHLLPRATVLENILLASRYGTNTDQKEVTNRALALAAQLSIDDRLDHFPNQLSGGQQQRVAIARALLNDPILILADEPTGNLDSKNSARTFEIFKDLSRQGKTIIIITHDAEIARGCGRVIEMRDGKIVDGHSSGTFSRTGDTNAWHPKSSTVPRGRFSYLLQGAVQGIFRNRVRSALTISGVMIGVAALVAMITLGNFTKRKILESYETLGSNKLSLFSGINYGVSAKSAPPPAQFQQFLPKEDGTKIQAIFEEVRLIAPTFYTPGQISTQGRSLDKWTNVIATDPNYLPISGLEIARGRNFVESDIREERSVCILGAELADLLFRKNEVLGNYVMVRDDSPQSYPCRAVGVLKKTPLNDGLNVNRALILPYTYYQSTGKTLHSRKCGEFVMKLREGSDAEKTGNAIKKYFHSRFGESGYFVVGTASKVISQMKRIIMLFNGLLLSVAGAALTVGALGISNMVLVSVTERFREFGLRRALGATRKDIRVQVMLESILLSTLAGIAGLMIGFAVSEGLIYLASLSTSRISFEWVFDSTALLFAFVSSVSTGFLSGIYPALRAERLEIIESLRSE